MLVTEISRNMLKVNFVDKVGVRASIKPTIDKWWAGSWAHSAAIHTCEWRRLMPHVQLRCALEGWLSVNAKSYNFPHHIEWFIPSASDLCVGVSVCVSVYIHVYMIPIPGIMDQALYSVPDVGCWSRNRRGCKFPKTTFWTFLVIDVNSNNSIKTKKWV